LKTFEETFTTIICHSTRLALNLSCNEYCIADLIYWRSGEGKEWTSISRQEIAVMMGLSKQSVISILEKLEAADIIQKNSEKQLRLTVKWTLHERYADEPLPFNLNINILPKVWHPLKELEIIDPGL